MITARWTRPIRRSGWKTWTCSSRRSSSPVKTSGIFNTAYGLSWFLGTALMGVLYGVSVTYLVAFSVGLELVSLPLLSLVRGEAVRTP